MPLLGSLLTYEGDFGFTFWSIWGHFWCMRVTLNHFGVTLEAFWGHLSTQTGPKTGNTHFSHVFCFSKMARVRGTQLPRERAEPSGRGKGEGKPSPLWACLRFWEVWRVCCWVQTSTRREARGLGGLKSEKTVPLLTVECHC